MEQIKVQAKNYDGDQEADEAQKWKGKELEMTVSVFGAAGMMEQNKVIL